MFGRMIVEPILPIQPRSGLQTSVAALIKVAENPEIILWIEFPNSLLLFLLVPGDPESGAVNVLDRKKGTWYSVDFEDEQFGGYSVSQLEMPASGALLEERSSRVCATRIGTTGCQNLGRGIEDAKNAGGPHFNHATPRCRGADFRPLMFTAIPLFG